MTTARTTPTHPPGRAPTDAGIIDASRRRPERFADVFDRHYTEIHRYVDRRLGADAADDIAAETFLVAFRKRASFDGRESARPWLYGIATRLVSRHRRDELRRYRALARLHTTADVENHDERITDIVTAAGAGLAPALGKLDLYLFTHAPYLLTGMSVRDEVRVATYRVLASLKGVRLVRATDASGRTARAVVMRQTTRQNGTIEWQLFIDPETGRLTADQGVIVTPGTDNAALRPGTRQYFEVVKTAEWTNAPARSLLPRRIWDPTWEPPGD